MGARKCLDVPDASICMVDMYVRYYASCVQSRLIVSGAVQAKIERSLATGWLVLDSMSCRLVIRESPRAGCCPTQS